MVRMNLSGSGTNQEMDYQSSVLPVYMPHLTLVFKLIATAVNLSFVSWAVFSIKVTRNLHKSHNIFLAYILISDTVRNLDDWCHDD